MFVDFVLVLELGFSGRVGVCGLWMLIRMALGCVQLGVLGY